MSAKIEVKCAVCGRPMMMYPSKANAYKQHLCSPECKSKWASMRTGERNSRWCGGLQAIFCAQCGKPIEKTQASVRSYEHHFCSPECNRQWRSEHLRGENGGNWHGGYKSTCTYCGRPVWVKPSRAHKERQFCSKECQRKWASENLIGPRSSNWQGGPEARTCKVCGKPFTVSRGEADRGGGQYCSKECATKDGMNGEIRSCAQCGHPFYVPKGMLATAKYCSRKCMYEAHKTSVRVRCANCGKELEVWPSRLRNTTNFFCSKECFGQYMQGANNPAYRGGKKPKGYPRGFNQVLKEYVRQRDGYRCQVCGVSEEETGKALSTHHIDYDKKNCDPSNLIALCNPCHTKTNNKDRPYWQSRLSALVQSKESPEAQTSQVASG